MKPEIAKLLNLVFISIRMNAYEGRSDVAFQMADLFHGFPMILATKGEAAAIQELFEHAERKGLADWLASWITGNRIAIDLPGRIPSKPQ